MTERITIITDSTSDIPKELIDRYGIIVMPLTVNFGEEEFKDKVDITNEEFYERLENSKSLPTTSQVNPSAFADIYKRELEMGISIISIHISSDLSGTYQSAAVAKNLIESDNISVIDSRTASIALGKIVLKAAELRDMGLDRKSIEGEIENYKNRVELLIVVDTLEYLKKGGRLSEAKAFIGTVLKLKPILTIKDGKVILIDKARGKKRAFNKIIDMIKENKSDNLEDVFGVANAKCIETVDRLKELIAEEYKKPKFIDTNVGSVIATHVGPGAFGVAYEKRQV